MAITKHDPEEVMDYIVLFKWVHDGVSPTIMEIGEDVGIPAKSNVRWILGDLQTKGLIEMKPKTARAIRVVGGYQNYKGGYEWAKEALKQQSITKRW